MMNADIMTTELLPSHPSTLQHVRDSWFGASEGSWRRCDLRPVTEPNHHFREDSSPRLAEKFLTAAWLCYSQSFKW